MSSIAEHMKAIILELGENPDRPGLQKTPERAAKALTYLTQGYHQNIDDIVNDALFDTTSREMIVVKDIEFYSLCEHHLLPFFGQCHIGYIPNNKILGLSKFGRIVDLFAQRLQVQENLTEQIATAIQQVTKAAGVGVMLNGKHCCMMMRGVQKQHASMKTCTMRGSFRESPHTQEMFLKLIK